MDILVKYAFESQTVCGAVHFLTFLISWPTIIGVLNNFLDKDRLTFNCDPKPSDVVKQRCYGDYTSTVSPRLAPLDFAYITCGVLGFLWMVFIVYSVFALRRIKREQDSTVQTDQAKKFMWLFLFHVCIQLAVLIVLIVLFISLQSISLPEVYLCSRRNSTAISRNQIKIMTCNDMYYRQKSKLNFGIIAILTISIILCVVAIIHLHFTRAKFLAQLLGQGDIDGGPQRSIIQQEISRAVTEYSIALKESIRSQTEYLAQVSPTLPNARTDHIFTNLLMQHGRKPVEDLDLERKECVYPHGQARRRKSVEDLDLKREKRLLQYGQMSGKQIKHSQEIFFSTDGKHPESVLVTGKAGIGKTLFCQKLIRDWADNKLLQPIANTEVPDFKFAYLLTFRQLNLLGDDPVTLKDIFNRSSVLDDHSNIDDSLFEYIVDHPEEVLIIIDGYDECSQRDYIASDSHQKYPNKAFEKMPVTAACAKLIKGKILRGSVVMITSRPDESDKMKDKDIHFDRYVEITGFSEPQVKEYIAKYFKNNEGMKNTVLDHITKNVNLVSFAHIPVLCFLMCSYFEYTLQHSDITHQLPVKTSDLYEEVVKMFVQKHDKNKRLPLEVTLDELSKLAAQLLGERRYLFIKEDLKTFNLQEVESLCGSGLLHCGPPFRKSFSATTKYFCFTHLTLQEYLAASWFVKERIPPPEHVSPEVFQFMSGILSKQKDAVLMEKLLEYIDCLMKISPHRILMYMFKCLMEYEDVEFAKRIVEKRHQDIFESEGSISFFFSQLTDVDCTALSFLFNLFSTLHAEEESVVNEGTSKRGKKWKLTTLDLSANQITDAGVVSLCQALQTPTCKLTTLDLSANQITDAGVVSLCQALQTTTCKLTTFDLSFNQITDAGVVSLCQALQTPTCKLTTLHLRENHITHAGVVSLCQALQTPTCKLTTLDLSANQITDAGVVSLCQALQTPTCKLTTFDLSANQITDAGVVSLCQALQTPTCKLTTLHLRENHITDAGVVSLCQALQTPTCKLTTLDLSANQITDAGVVSLCQALQTPTCKLTTLDLSFNQITDAGVVSLCQALQTPTCKLTTLDLSFNQITDAGVVSLCQALQTPTCKLTTLDLSFNQITDAGVVSLSQALQTLTRKLTTLHLSKIKITDAGVVSLCQALQTPTCKLTTLHLSTNRITDAGVVSLCQALQTPTCKLTTLHLRENQITDAGVVSLCQALQTPTCKLTTLDLSANQITDAGVVSLCQALQTPTCTLTTLHLVFNKITDAGKEHLKKFRKGAPLIQLDF